MRLPGYDYSRPGAYFVTVVAQDRKRRFGEVVDGTMQLNDVGRMILRWFYALEQRFANVVCDTVVCMPDHIHFVLIILDDATCAGAEAETEADNGEDSLPAKPDLSRIVGWFKAMTTNEYIRRVRANEWPPFRKRLWQRNYYESIVHDTESLQRVREYIANNPTAWES